MTVYLNTQWSLNKKRKLILMYNSIFQILRDFYNGSMVAVYM